MASGVVAAAVSASAEPAAAPAASSAPATTATAATAEPAPATSSAPATTASSAAAQAAPATTEGAATAEAAPATQSAPVVAEAAPAQAEGGPAATAAVPLQAEAEPAKTENEGEEAGGKGKKKKADAPRGQIELGGRVFAGAAFVSREQALVDATGVPVERRIDSLDLELASARFKLEYQAPIEWLSAEIETELRGRPELKDAYVQARSKTYSARVGQFKMPFSAFALESPWTLPMTHRGAVHDMLSDVLQVAGRRAGVAFTARRREGLKPKLELGAFQGSVLVDALSGDTDPAEERFFPAQHVAARFSVKIDDLVAGLNYQHRMATPGLTDPEYYWTAGADLTLDLDWQTGGFRAWLEGIAGATWLEHPDKPEDGEDAQFVSLRLIAAPRFGGVAPHEFYVEPYVMGALLEPDAGGVVSDLLLEAAAGVNVGFWDLVRLGIQGEGVRAERNFPVAYYRGNNPERLALLAQVGVRF